MGADGEGLDQGTVLILNPNCLRWLQEDVSQQLQILLLDHVTNMVCHRDPMPMTMLFT